MTCVPAALAQKGGFALGAQAGERNLREVLIEVALQQSGERPRRRSISC